MIPTIEQAEELLKEAVSCNPGPWEAHSRVAAFCARQIAESCPGMDAQKAYVLGLLHDIGRKFGGRHLGHVSDGYSYMTRLGYDEVARVCLSHSFNDQSLLTYIGKVDTTREEYALVERTLAAMVYDDYDRLIQLCDTLATANGPVRAEERMADVRRRYGSYPQDKWEDNLYLLQLFSEKSGESVYKLVGVECDSAQD